MKRLRLKTDKHLAHGHTECLWTVPMHPSHSNCLLIWAHLGGSSPKCLGGSDFQPHVNRTHSVKHAAHRTAAGVPQVLLFLRSTKENSTCEQGQAQIRFIPTNHPEIPGMKWWLGGGRRTPQQACLGQIPGLGRTSQEDRLDQYQTPGVQVTRDLICCP